MINYCLEDFVSAMRCLEYVSRDAEQVLVEAQDDVSLFLSDKSMRKQKMAFAHLEEGFNPLSISRNRLISIKVLIENGGFYSQLAHELRALESDVKAAAAQIFFYHYPYDKARMIARVEMEWPATLSAFPSAKEDVLAAIDCHALGHSKASIYHSMMVLEHGLPAFAKRLQGSDQAEAR